MVGGMRATTVIAIYYYRIFFKKKPVSCFYCLKKCPYTFEAISALTCQCFCMQADGRTNFFVNLIQTDKLHLWTNLKIKNYNAILYLST